MKIREAAVSGMFYPSNKEEIENMINNFLEKVPSTKIKGKIKALIVPHAGYVYSGQVAAYAYKLLSKDKKLKTILLGPSHHVHSNELTSDVNDYWLTPLGKVKVAKNELKKLEEAHIREHCLEVQLPFLQSTLNNFEILPIVTGNVDIEKAANNIRKLLNDNTLLIISSDLSHFYDYDTAVKLDTNTNKAIEKLDYDKMLKEGDACGKTPILILINLAKKLKWNCKLLEYKNSGDTAGSKDSVVGYSSFVFYENAK